MISCRQVTPDEDDKEEAALMTRMRAFYLSNPENMKKWAAKVQTEYGALGMPGVDGELAPVYMTSRVFDCVFAALPRRHNRAGTCIDVSLMDTKDHAAHTRTHTHAHTHTHTHTQRQREREREGK